MTEKQPRHDWSAAPTVIVSRTACPHCWYGKYDRVRTNDNGDGSSTKLCVCRACNGTYKIVEEFPESGIEVVWPL